MAGKDGLGAGKRSRFAASVLFGLYGATRNKAARSLLRSLVLRLEAGPVYSLTIRDIYRRHHDVTVGLYTIGPCDVAPGNLAPGTVVGRYSSVYYTVRTLTRDRAFANGSADQLFSPSALDGLAEKGERTNIIIGNDVWIGHNAIVLPSAEEIGDGAVVGAGSVVQSRVPPYAVVAGNPARVVRYRFSEGKIKEMLESKWWLKNIDELSERMEEFQRPQEVGAVR